jgi:hypothetical protein
MQIKNRIQMLENAIIDSGVATGLDLGLSKTTTAENDGESPGRQSFSTPASDLDAALDLDLQNLNSFDFNPSPNSLDESNFFANQDFFENWYQHDLALDQETSPLPFMAAPNQHLSDTGSSGSSHRLIQPWPELSISDSQSDILGSQLRNGSIETEISTPSVRKESLRSTQTCGQSKKISLAENGNAVRILSWNNEIYEEADSFPGQGISNRAKESTGSKREDNSIPERGEQAPEGVEHGLGDDV